MMRGSARGVGIGCIVGEFGVSRFVVRVTGLLPPARISEKNQSCGITPCQVDSHIKQNV